MKCNCGFSSEEVVNGPWVQSYHEPIAITDEQHAESFKKRDHYRWIRLWHHLRVCPKCGAVYVQMNQDGFIDNVSGFLKDSGTVGL